MRPAHAKSVGKRRFAAAAAVLLEPPPVSETIDILDHTGNTTIDITDITGVGIGNFNMITVTFKDATTSGSGSGVAKGVRVSTDGGSIFIATGYQRLTPGTVSDDTMIVQAAAGTPFDSICRLINTDNPDILTMFKSVRSGDQVVFGDIDSTLIAIDALQFVVVGGPTWTSGFITVQGYR